MTSIREEENGVTMTPPVDGADGAVVSVECQGGERDGARCREVAAGVEPRSRRTGSCCLT